LRAVLIKDAATALGLAIGHLMSKPAYESIGFASWSRVLIGQINRGHYRFIMDNGDRVAGFLGWTYTDRETAENWVAGKSGKDAPQPGNCVVFNVWSSERGEVGKLLLDSARQAMQGCDLVYYRRLYANGRVRPVRLSVNAFVQKHMAANRQTRATAPPDAASPGQPARPPGRPPAMRAATPAAGPAAAGPGMAQDRGARTGSGGLTLARVRPPARALGLAASYLRTKPVYAGMKFNAWSQVLAGQANRGHCLFAFDAGGRVAGLLGWSLADREAAEQWVMGKIGARIGGMDGDCILFNLFSADDDHVRRLLLAAGARQSRDCRMVYFRRRYPDGSMRPVRIPAGAALQRLAGAAPTGRNFPDQGDE
jgi:hemolysin-activating ACP:hemolysin acyltransferase